jgi:hypothetical protein
MVTRNSKIKPHRRSTFQAMRRVGRTFAFETVKKGEQGVAGTDRGIQAPSAAHSAPAPGGGGGEKRISLNFNLFVNVFNHLSLGGWVGNLSSPLFAQSTVIYPERRPLMPGRSNSGCRLSF